LTQIRASVSIVYVRPFHILYMSKKQLAREAKAAKKKAEAERTFSATVTEALPNTMFRVIVND